jgi:hypothetical protein
MAVKNISGKREPNLIKTSIKPISNEVKTKISVAVLDFVNRIKEKHLV